MIGVRFRRLQFFTQVGNRPFRQSSIRWDDSYCPGFVNSGGHPQTRKDRRFRMQKEGKLIRFSGDLPAADPACYHCILTVKYCVHIL